VHSGDKVPYAELTGQRAHLFIKKQSKHSPTLWSILDSIMRNNKNSAIAREIIVCLFIILFAYTGFSKWLDNRNFELVLAESPLVGSYANFLAVIIPSIEIIIAILLIVPLFKRAGLISSFFLMGIFSLYVGYMVIFIPHVPCSCGGVIRHMSWRDHLLFNIACTLLAGLGVKLCNRHQLFIAINRSR
jgi:uncharacterized membrane protein YphA (DoxX/SURF4 family)